MVKKGSLLIGLPYFVVTPTRLSYRKLCGGANVL